MKIPNTPYADQFVQLSLARIVSEDSQQAIERPHDGVKSSKDS